MRIFGRQADLAAGFAVVDVETTGLYPSSDRVVEVAVVHLDEEGRVTGEFCTLIDPRRDVGATRIHRIRAVDLVGAPVFSSAAAAIWGMLAGRVLVAHNASFDARFLAAEFARCGAQMPAVPVMCTMQLAANYLRGLPARSLVACCQAAGVELSEHHSALADARAAAGLLAAYRSAHRQLPGSWREALVDAAGVPWPTILGDGEFRPVTRAEQTLRRAGARSPLADLVDRLPRGTSGDLDPYLALLDVVLEDRIVSDGEAAKLLELATELGLTRDAADRAHREYLGVVSAVAWRDGRVTDAERDDLLNVARILAVPGDDALAILESSRSEQHTKDLAAPFHAGDRVVFTGEMTMSRTEVEALATAAGLRVTSAVSGKTALLVTADPYSQSGKAERARALGVRIVTEHVFMDMIDRMDLPTEKADA